MPESIEAVLTSKLESLKLMSRRLELLDSHDAMYLLKNCFSLPKLNYFLRASPCFLKEDLLKEYDEVIRESLVSILNIKLDGTSNIQYSLPVSLGGLGIRSSVDISIPLVNSRRLILGILIALAAPTAMNGTNLPMIGGIFLTRPLRLRAVTIQELIKELKFNENQVGYRREHCLSYNVQKYINLAIVSC